MYEFSVEVWYNPLEDPDIYHGDAEDYEEAVTDAAELAEADAPEKAVITITKRRD